MAKHAGLWLSSCLIIVVACLQLAGCTNAPASFNSVILKVSSSKVGPNTAVTITATVPADKTNSGVTWVFTPGTGAPANPGTFNSTLTSATFTSPASVPTQFTVSIQATSVAIPTDTRTVTITITTPTALTITTTSLPNGSVGRAYSAQLAASGGVTPYTWALSSTSSALPAGLSLAATGAVSGSPTQTGSVTINVQVTDSETPPVVVTGNVTINITNLLSGNYAFEFSGFNASGNVVVAGSFVSDGVSKISGGIEDVNSLGAAPAHTSFTGTYTLQANNQGQLVFSSLPGSPTYDFAIDATGVHGRMIESDTTGVRGSGELAQQSTSTCGSQTLSGPGPVGADFVIGVTGAEGNFAGTTPGPFAMAGRFTAEVPSSSTTSGNIDNGQVDITAPGGQVIAETMLSGTFQTTSQPGVCTMTVSQTLANMTFHVYPIASANSLVTQAYVIETDTLSATTPFLSVGKLIHQTGYPFGNPLSSFTATSVGALAGPAVPTGGTSYLPFASVIEVQANNGGNAFTMPLQYNFAGSVNDFLGSNAITASFNNTNQYGRVDTDLVTPPVSPVFYIIDTNEAFCILDNPNTAVIGVLEPQSMGTGTSFTASTIAGNFIEGTSAPSLGPVQDFVGVTTLTNTSTTAGTVAGALNLSLAGGNSSGNVTGTYALTSSGQTDGSGTLNLTQAPPPPDFAGGFFIVSPTKAVIITTTAGDVNPTVTILGEQTDDFGVN